MIVVIVCLVAAVVFAVSRMADSNFDWRKFFETLKGSNGVLIALSALVIALTYVGRAFRWQAMMRPICPHPSFSKLLGATVVGFTAVVFFGRPGELVRPWLIARQERISVSSQLATWLLERVLDLLMVLLLFGFALTRVRPSAGMSREMQTVLASGGVLALTLGLVCVTFIVITALSRELSMKIFNRITGLLPRGIADKLSSTFDSFLTGMSSTGSLGSLSELLAWSVLEWGLILAAIHLALTGYPPTAHLRILDTIVFAGFVTFGGAVQLPGIGGGMQVTAVLVSKELFGLGIESATGLALLVWVLTWLTVVPFGLVTAFAQGLKWGALRHVEEEAKP